MDSVKQALVDRLSLAREARRLSVIQSHDMLVQDTPEVAATPVLELLDELWNYERTGNKPGAPPKNSAG